MARWTNWLMAAALACGTAGCEREATAPPTGEPPAAASAEQSTATTAATPTADPASCLTYDGAYAAAPLMQVRGAADERVNLMDRAEACPAGAACGWRRDAYLVGGDVVFVSAPVNGFRCAYYATAGSEIAAGFIPADRLEPAEDAEPLTPEFLSGAWTFEGDNRVVFNTSGGRTTAQGKAAYGEEGAQNFGQFEGPVTLAGPTAVYAGDGCEVSARRRGPYLVVNDNGSCGGMNVSFDGIYVRAKG